MLQKILLLLLILTSLHAGAASRCEDLFLATLEVRQGTSLKDLGLEAPEIEAKFLIPNKATYEDLKSLIGRKITLKDNHGLPVVYVVEMNKQHIYRDTNLDTKDLSLFNRRGMLRQRERYDLNPKSDKYKLNKVVFQAKDGPSTDSGMNEAVFARNEIRGEEHKNLKKFLRKRDRRLREDSEDAAVQFARDYSQSDKKFKPVLKIEDHRFFMKLTPQITNGETPCFYISLDNVKYKGLTGRKGKAERLELEAEIIDDLNLDSVDVGRAKLSMMDRLSEFLKAEFKLPESPESKYESGVKLTILP